MDGKTAEELGIPADFFENSAKRFDRNIDNKDSLIKIATRSMWQQIHILKIMNGIMQQPRLFLEAGPKLFISLLIWPNPPVI